MDHKKFILELQKRTGLDKSRLNALLKSTREVLCEQAINLNQVELEGVGLLEPKKKLEFIHEDRHTGEQILYPPRLVLHFTADPRLVKSTQDKI